MMKFIFMMIFMMPLSFCSLKFWFNQFIYLFLTLFFFCFGFNYLFVNVGYGLGADLLSYSLILLSIWICSLMIMSSGNIYSNKVFSNLFLLVLLILLISLYCTFASLNVFIFYLFFEISLIPTLILILGWGYQPERIQAGVYLLFYTLFASLPMMISVFYVYNYFDSMIFFFLDGDLNYLVFYFCVNLVFFIKIPMFLVHLWLPKAHVEAPVSGSMILAGIMLKLGGYGLMRFMVIMMGVGLRVNFFIISMSMVGGILISLICLRQGDMKSLIAYSSVAHMGLALSGIMTLNYWGMCGALMMMVAHGLCSSSLFCLANISYERLMSRSLYLNKGLINLMPSMSFWWFLLSCSNMSAPPSLNLVGEIVLFNSTISWSFFLMIILFFLSFFSGAYSLYLYSYTQHGKIYLGMYSFFLGYIREYLLLFLHWFPLNMLIFKSEYFMMWV
uniref:NADH-ubiquinone oxidoreductase chain 4 n=1 Tax=Dascillus cervinus TaxID=285223 RepID=H6W8I6_9COLE|nr:NADH dehydrogenase subunit 4 [Dascillus cervinus]